MRTALLGVSTTLAFLLASCGGGEDVAETAAEPTSAETAQEPSTQESDEVPDPESSEAEPAVGDACALLDPAYLNGLMQGESTLLGTPYEFQEPLTQSPSAFCAWKEGTTGLALQVTLEPAATSEIDDHGGRAYNIDVEPVPVPQDGPGTSAVLLTDPAFEDSADENFAYGYFFVADDVTVFVESVGLDLGEEKLRAMADEAADRLGSR